MNTLEKTELSTSVRHIEKFSKSGIPINNSEVPDTVDRKMRRRRGRITQPTVKCYVFHANGTVHTHKNKNKHLNIIDK